MLGPPIDDICYNIIDHLRKFGFPELSQNIHSILTTAMTLNNCEEELENILRTYIARKGVEWASRPKGPPPSIKAPIVILSLCNCARKLKKVIRNKR